MFHVKYKQRGQLFWRTVKNVKGDTNQSVCGDSHLMLIFADESCLLIPIEGTQFKFDKERHYLILKRMEAEAGQKITLKAD